MSPSEGLPDSAHLPDFAELADFLSRQRWFSGRHGPVTVTGVRRLARLVEVPPVDVLMKLDAAVAAGGTVTLGAVAYSDPKFDLRWTIMHGAASAACAAASPAGDSGLSHVVLTHPQGVTCAAACAANTNGQFNNCRTSIAVGSIRQTQALLPTDVVSINYNYGCGDAQKAYDETKGEGVSDGSYAAYCCCYH